MAQVTLDAAADALAGVLGVDPENVAVSRGGRGEYIMLTLKQAQCLTSGSEERPDVRADRLACAVIDRLTEDASLSVYNAMRDVLIAEFSGEEVGG